MANMALNIEQLVGQKLTNEQYILWFAMYNLYPNMKIEPVFLSGTPAGTGLNVYNATYFYIAYQLYITRNSAIPSGPGSYSQAIIYDHANVQNITIEQNICFWDATAANYRSTQLIRPYYNLIIGRIAPSSLDYVNLIGYRIYH